MRTAAKTAMLMAMFTLISKLFGFIREMVMANYFGTSFVTDAYVMSFTIMTVLVGGIVTATSTAYIPIFSKLSETHGEQEGIIYTSAIINMLLIVSLIFSLVGILFSDGIISVLASGFRGETAALASFYLRVLFFYGVVLAVSGILESYLQYKNVFLPQIVSGYFVSICTIILIIVSAYTNYYFLAFGILLGYFLRFIGISVIAKKKNYKHRMIFRNSSSKETFSLALPTFLGSYMLYINQFIDKTLASNLVEGSISALNYAFLLTNMIIAVAITILSTVIYPKLAQANSLGLYERFSYITSNGFNIIVIIALPFSLGSMVYSNQVIQIVYERGSFDSVATAMTSSAFFYYSAGLLFIALNDLFAKIYFSVHDTKTPMVMSAIGIGINIVLNLILVQYMKHSGLALATSIASFSNTLLLYYGLKKKYSEIVIITSIKYLSKIVIASFIAVGGSAVFYMIAIKAINDIIYMRVVQLGLAVLVAVLIYYILLRKFDIKELELLKQLKK